MLSEIARSGDSALKTDPQLPLPKMPQLRGGDALAIEDQGSVMSARSIMPQPVSQNR